MSDSPHDAGHQHGLSGPARAWRPAIAIQFTIVIHLTTLLALLFRPAWWPWVVAALAANHLALGLIGMWPRSRLLGDNIVRLPDAAARRAEIALTFDDGPHADVTPKVLDILDHYGAKASFFCVGNKAAAHPEIVREIIKRGHSIENHSMHHSAFFGFYGPAALRREIGAAQSVLGGIARHPPRFFRAPMGIRNPMLDPVVTRMGLHYTSWTRRGFDTVAHDPIVVLERLAKGLAAGDILLLHDRRSIHGEPIVLTVLPALLEKLSVAGLKPVSLTMAMR
jgi:peptidoglycan/xylan/chitin deacetylase (PgdA/CDA1 family)